MTNGSGGQYGVAVGVDGSAEGYAAVRYAATEAERLRLPLDVVHVLPADVPVVPGRLPVPEGSLQRFGADFLARAQSVASETVPGLEVRAHLRTGRRVGELTTVSSGAAALVIGSRSPRALDRVWTGGTVTGVASGAVCPLIVVPADWEKDLRHDRIGIGVKGTGDDGDLFALGFPLAAERRAELVVVHAWRLDGIYDRVIADPTGAESCEQEKADRIEQQLAPYRDAFPGVPVHLFIRHEDPAHALVRVSRGADRLLIQRPPKASTHHLGRVARAVLREARCPIVVLPAHPERPVGASEDTFRTVVSAPSVMGL